MKGTIVNEITKDCEEQKVFKPKLNKISYSHCLQSDNHCKAKTSFLSCRAYALLRKHTERCSLKIERKTKMFFFISLHCIGIDTFILGWQNMYGKKIDRSSLFVIHNLEGL